MHIVSAWASDFGITLGQVATEEKSNEITAIPQLLERIDVQDAIVTIDAAGCQKTIAAKIVQGKGDYVLALKGNQEKLLHDVEFLMLGPLQDDFGGGPVSRYVEVEQGHGRRHVDLIRHFVRFLPHQQFLVTRLSHRCCLPLSYHLSPITYHRAYRSFLWVNFRAFGPV
jgi:hypothetical protein